MGHLYAVEFLMLTFRPTISLNDINGVKMSRRISYHKILFSTVFLCISEKSRPIRIRKNITETWKGFYFGDDLLEKKQPTDLIRLLTVLKEGGVLGSDDGENRECARSQNY